MIKESEASSVVKTAFVLDGRPTAAAYKRACYRSWRKAILALFRPSRSLRAWHLGHALRERGIDAARPLLVCEPRTGGLRWESYLATEWVDGDHLHEYALRIAALAPASGGSGRGLRPWFWGACWAACTPGTSAIAI